MCRGNCQSAALVIAKVARRLFDVFYVIEQIGYMLEDGVSSRRYRSQFLARAFKYLNVELIFQQFYLVADTRLRGIELFGRCRNVQVIAYDRIEKA